MRTPEFIGKPSHSFPTCAVSRAGEAFQGGDKPCFPARYLSGCAAPAKCLTAFSLIELLVVVAIMGILFGLASMVFSGRAQDMNRAASTVSDILQQARTYAMSKNTYVYVGLSDTESETPELTVGVVEARDGLASNSNALVADAGRSAVRSIQRATFMRGVQLDTATARANLPGFSLPQSTDALVEEIETSQIRLPAEIVTRRGDVTGSEYGWVVQFSPDGAARLDATERTVLDYIILGMIPAKGDSANAVGLVIDGPSGAIRVVRPDA